MARILVVDDDEQVRRVLRLSLQRAGHEVEEAENGERALLLFRARPPDLLITDIVMPHKEGIETISELRSEYPDVKIIAISGGGRIAPHDYLLLARRFGAQRTFTKPIDRKALLLAVEEMLAE